MTKADSQDSISDEHAEYNLMGAYYRDIGDNHFLSAEEEQKHSGAIQQGFTGIIRTVCDKRYDHIPSIQTLRNKIENWKKKDKSFKPKQQILNEISRDVANLAASSHVGKGCKQLQRKIEVHCHKIAVARDIMVHANLLLVVVTAKRYVQTQLTLGDLIQEGNLGLMRAALRFNHSRGFRFSTYAIWWIKQSITKAIADKGREIRVPYHFYELSKKYFRIFQAQKEYLGRKPTLHEMSKAAEIPMNKVLSILESANTPLSLETPVGDDSGTMIQFLENERAESPYHQALLQERHLKLQECLSLLTDRQRDVVCQRFGLNGYEEATLQEIGDRFQVTRECIRQTEVRALRRLQVSSRAQGIEEYCAL